MQVVPQRTKVFISYSHKDEEWLNQLRVHLRPVERRHSVEIWDDRKMQAGTPWRETIEGVLAETKVAILLVSADFLASDFIAMNELPPLLTAAASEGVTIIPVILRPSLYQSEPVSQFQAINDPARPLSGLSSAEQESIFVKLGERIKALFGAQPPGPAAARVELPRRGARGLRGPVDDFIGRGDECEQIVAAIRRGVTEDNAIGVIRGMGGVGKTELALTVAAAIGDLVPDGQHLVDLRGESDEPLTPDQALRTVIAMLVGEVDPRKDLGAQYRDALAGRRMLILADNAQGAEQLRALIPPPGCALLVTTRRRFTLPRMVPVDLDSLSEEEAVALLTQVCPRIGDAAPQLATLCGRLPLALRVAASMLASDDSLRVERHIERLTDLRTRSRLLRDPDDKQLDVEASLNLSHGALEPGDQQVLCQLAVFPDSFETRAAGAVVQSADGDVETALSLLRRRSMVEWSESSQRYHLHDLVKAFALRRLADEDNVRLRHARYFAAQVSRAKQAEDAVGESTDDESTGDEWLESWDFFDAEEENIRAAWRWAAHSPDRTLADQLLIDYALGMVDGIGDNLIDPELMDASLAALARHGRHQDALELLQQLGNFYVVPQPPLAMRYYTQARQHALAIGDRLAAGRLLVFDGIALGRNGDAESELAAYTEALSIGRELGDRGLAGSALLNMANAYAGIADRLLVADGGDNFRLTADASDEPSDAEEARRLYDEARATWQEAAVTFAEAMTLACLGRLNERAGAASSAVDAYEQALSKMDTSFPDNLRRQVLRGLAELSFNAGDDTAARRYAELLRDEAHGERQTWQPLTALLILCRVAQRQRDVAVARDYEQQAFAVATAAPDRRMLVEAATTVAYGYSELGDKAAAVSLREQAVAACRQLDDLKWLGALLCSLGDAYIDAGRHEDGAGAFQEATGLGLEGASLYDAYNGLGRALVLLDRGDEAAEAYLRAMSADPSQTGAPVMLGAIRQAKGQYDAALAAYEQVLALEGEADHRVMALRAIGNVRSRRGQYAEAMAAYDGALDAGGDPADEAETREAVGDLWRVQGRYDLALDAYERSARLDPRFAYPAAMALELQGRLDEALAEYRRACEADPEDPRPLLGLARLHHARQARTEAKIFLERSRELSRSADYADDAAVQARLAAADGDVETAVARLQAAIENRAVWPALLRHDPDYKALRDDDRFLAMVGAPVT